MRDCTRTRATRRHATALAVLLALTSATLGCSDGDDTDGAAREPDRTERSRRTTDDDPDDEDGRDTTTSTWPDDASPLDVPELEWDGCGRGLECATLEVPLDWEDPTGDTIELAVARRPATGDPDDRLGILAVNPGGPGASGVETVQAAPMMGLAGLNEYFDLVSWDPRGVGDSTGIDCDDDLLEEFQTLDPDPDDDAEQDELHETAEAYAEACLDDPEGLAPTIGTNQTIQDLDFLRAALGEEQLSWLGFSYGTFLGQRYAERYPERVRAMVLDGVVDPADGIEGMLTGQAIGFEEFLDDLFADCGRDPSCPVDDPDATLAELLQEVELDPVPGGRSGDLGPWELQTAMFTASYDATLAEQFLEGLAEAADGDGSGLVGLARLYQSLGDYPAYMSTVCADTEFPKGRDEAIAMAERLERKAPRIGAAVANEILPCAYLPTSGPPPAPVTAPGTPPILVIGNTGDVATPVEQAERVAEALDAGVLLVHEGTGHTSFGSSDCVDAIVESYLIDLDVPDDGEVCPG